MPEPLGAGQRYMPGLDGLRAVAVAAVVIYHLGAPWLPGGLLGVGVFFTLSGYLITDLLLGEWRASGRLRLRDFWLRRARRLLPALFVLLAVVLVWVAVGDPSGLRSLRGDALSAALYVNNWWMIAQHTSYFARFGPPSPLGNLWSLAVEEQFYLVWPWLLLAGLVWSHRPSDAQRRARRRRILLGLTIALAAASAIEMAVLYHPSLDPTRVYDGTDTRAFGLLLGASLAMVWPSRDPRRPTTRAGVAALDLVGLIGLAGIVVLMWRTTQYSAFLYRGGMALLSLSTVLVLASVVHPRSHLGRMLGCAPLRRIGLWSYAIYLWHYPIIALTTPTVTHGFDAERAGLQVAATLAIAAASWHFIETPIRHGALGWWWRCLRELGWRAAVSSASSRAALAGTGIGLAAALIAVSGAMPSGPADLTAVGSSTTDLGHSVSGIRHVSAPPPPTTATTAPPGASLTGPGAGWDSRPAGGATAPVPPVQTQSPPPAAAPGVSSCTSVVHIGDSTSESLVSDDYLRPSQQLPAQYAQVGVRTVDLQISGARSLVETLDGHPNGQTVAAAVRRSGYHGCWVIALGTNDSANIAVGSPVDAAQRIKSIMSVIGDQPVMWVNVVSLLSSGPYAESHMAAWDRSLLQACPAYPNMRVYDWASVAKPDWFISDGIHYSSLGSAHRAHDIAQALARAFPQGVATRQTPNTAARCVVH